MGSWKHIKRDHMKWEGTLEVEDLKTSKYAIHNTSIKGSISPISSIQGNAIYLDGTEEYVNIDALQAATASNTTGTWAMWVRPHELNTGDVQNLMSISDTSNDHFVRIFVNGSNPYFQAICDKDSAQFNVYTGEVFVVDTWTHVALVQDGTEAKLYVNGSEADVTWATSADRGAWLNDLSGLDNARIGDINTNNAGEDDFFHGDIDEVGVWSRDLTADEISDLYNSGSGLYINPSNSFPSSGTPVSTNLEAVYHMDESVGTNVSDSSGNSYDGTAVNTDASNWVLGKVYTEGGAAIDTYRDVINISDGVSGSTYGEITIGQTDVDVTIADGLNVTGTTTLSSNLNIVGDVDLTGDLTQTGDYDITGDVDVTGSCAISQDLTTSGVSSAALRTGKNINVTGTASAAKVVALNGHTGTINAASNAVVENGIITGWS